MTNHWLCQVCRQETDEEVIVEIINVNPRLGPIGSYPMQASEDERDVFERYARELAKTKGVAREDLALGLSEIRAAPKAAVNVGLTARHTRCVANSELQGYWINSDRARRLEDWIGWLDHLTEKSWLGRDDLVRLMRFWWTHKGEQPGLGA